MSGWERLEAYIMAVVMMLYKADDRFGRSWAIGQVSLSCHIGDVCAFCFVFSLSWSFQLLPCVSNQQAKRMGSSPRSSSLQACGKQTSRKGSRLLWFHARRDAEAQFCCSLVGKPSKTGQVRIRIRNTWPGAIGRPMMLKTLVWICPESGTPC